MLGSAEAGGKMLQKISDFARKTPFTLPEVVEGAKKLLAYNIEAEKLLPTLKMLGDISAGVGRDKLPQLILAFGQVKAATFLTGMELRQFTEAGVPLLELLAKQSGKTAAQVKQDMEDGMRIPFEDVEKALMSTTSEGGKFFDLMGKQAKTFGGVMSNIQDNIGRFARNIVGISDTGDIREGSIFARLRDGATRLLEWMDQHGPEIEAWAQNTVTKIADSGERTIKVIQQLIDWFQKLPQPVKDLGGSFVGAVAAFTIFAGLVSKVAKIFGPLIAVFKGVAAAVGVGGAGAGAVGGTILAAFLAVGAAIYLLITKWDELSPRLRSFLGIIGGPITMIIFLFQELKDKITTAIDWVKQNWDGFVDFISGIPGRIGEWLSQLPGVVWNAFLAVVEAIGYAAGRFIRFIIEDIPNFINSAVNWFSQLPGRIGAWVANMVETVVAWIASLPGRVWGWLQHFGNTVVDRFHDMKNRAINALADFINNAANWMAGLPGRLLGALGDIGGRLFDKFREIGGRAWEGFKRGLGISSPSFIERALFAIHDTSLETVDRMKADIKKLNQMASTLTRPIASGLSGSLEMGNLAAIPSMAATAAQQVANTANSVSTAIYGGVQIYNQADEDRFMERLSRNQELALAGMATREMR